MEHFEINHESILSSRLGLFFANVSLVGCNVYMAGTSCGVREASGNKKGGSTRVLEPPVEIPDVTGELLDVAEIVTQAVQEDAYMNMEQEAEKEDAELLKDALKANALAPFTRPKSATSPTKVSQLALPQAEN